MTAPNKDFLKKPLTQDEKERLANMVDQFLQLPPEKQALVTEKDVIWFLSALETLGISTTEVIRTNYKNNPEFKKAFDSGFTTAVEKLEHQRKDLLQSENKELNQAQTLLAKKPQYIADSEIPKGDEKLKKQADTNILSQRMKPVRK